jgi:ABC-type nitrate/sulfonate/bicarbonate transport system ATPase subunit
MPQACLLEARDLRKSFLYRGALSVVLDKLDFCQEEGQFISIVGPSGCGKSTFLELLCGVSLPDSGSIHFAGNEITGKTGILGYMPQDDLLFPWLNVMQNILLPVKVKGGNIAIAKTKVEKMVPLFGLENHLFHLPAQLSGGLKQRVALLRTYMTDSRLLLLDEPFAKLDAITRSQLQLWLKELVVKLKLTVILVTHDIEEAILLSDRIDLMSMAPGTFVRSFALMESQKVDLTASFSLKQEIRSLLAT